MLLKNGRRSQAAIDFVTAYGVALVVITISLAVIYRTSILSPYLVTSACTAVPNFSCDSFVLKSTGVLTVTISQATGGQMTVNGAACSTLLNSTAGRGPQFGNVGVTGSSLYYPSANWLNGATAPNTLYSDSGATMTLNCYSSSGLASGSVGNSFIGYLWLNYTVPSSSNTVQRIVSLDMVYS
jgi:hypothetical protein